MRQLADGLWQLKGFPPHAINVYLAGDVLFDAGTRRAGKRILGQVQGRRLIGHALTHAHADHQGSSHLVCTTLGLPLWCGENDADAMEQGTILAGMPRHPANRLAARFWTGPPHPVARRLRDDDEVGGFTVIETPGHSPGHVAYWRASDRVLIAGDVLNNMDVDTGIRGLREPKRRFTTDPERNRASIRTLAALQPELVVFGHGPPLRDPERLSAFAAALPR